MRFLQFCAICAALRAAQMAISNSRCIKHKIATLFCAFKTLTGFVFEFTEVSPHFCELVLDQIKHQKEASCAATRFFLVFWAQTQK